jgi:thiol-disulfide isomerase/thioredoxin
MKKLSITFIMLLALQWLFASPVSAASEIQFEQSAWAEVLSKAESQHKLVFLDAYTSWCGPCKWMAKTAFTDSTVADYFNDHFINVTIDMEKGEGIELAKQYTVTAYPTLLFLDGTGKMVHLAVGARSAQDLLQLGKDVIEGRTVSIPDLQAKYEAGNRDRKFLHDYVLELARANMPYDKPLEDYKPFMRGDALLDADNWDLFKVLFRRYDSEFAQYFLNHRPQFEAKFGKEEVENKTLGFYNHRLYLACEAKDKTAYETLKSDVKTLQIKDEDLVLCQIDEQWFVANEDWKHYAEAIDALQTMGKANQYTLNGAAWTFYEKANKKSLLKKALLWVNASIAIEKSSANVDTQAMLLYKLGQKDQAIAAAKESIQMGKANDEDVSETEKALAKWLK